MARYDWGSVPWHSAWTGAVSTAALLYAGDSEKSDGASSRRIHLSLNRTGLVLGQCRLDTTLQVRGKRSGPPQEMTAREGMPLHNGTPSGNLADEPAALDWLPIRFGPGKDRADRWPALLR